MLASGLTQIVDENIWFKVHRWSAGILTSHHYGEPAAPEAVRVFEAALFKRGLIERTQDSRIVRLDSDVKALVLASFAQALRARLVNSGVVIHPITDSWGHSTNLRMMLMREAESGGVLMQDFYRPKAPYSDVMNPRQLESDLMDVGADLSSVPLDEVLDFRRQNGDHYRAYAAALRQFLTTLSQISPAEREVALNERRLEILDQAAELRRISRAAFGVKSSALLLSLIGASWTAKHGDLIGALLAALSASIQVMPTSRRTVTAYSYLLRIRSLE
jgi:hypothetical protein